MPITIGSNISSLKAQRQLVRASDALSSTYERLSSGQRINKASDDAAGLAIAESLKARTHVNSQAIRNVNDGVSLLNIASGAVEQLSQIVIRQQELAEQAANGTYSSRQRVALNREALALTREYNRIVQSTTFNGQLILDGTDDTTRLQHGYGTEQSTSVSVGGEVGYAAGDGTFRVAQTITGASPFSASVGDLDGDGDLDIVTAFQAAALIEVQLNRGDGTFVAGQTYSSGTGSNLDGQLVDLNGDSKLDYVVVNRDNSVSWFIGRGDGTFAAERSISTGTGGLNYDGRVQVGDFNGDGRADVAVSQDTPNSIIIYSGQTNGDLQEITRLTNTDLNFAVADFNGDGYSDIASNRIYYGNASGSFTAGATVVSGAYSDIIAVDLNNDGRMDLATIELSSYAYGHIQNADGSFTRGVSTNFSSIAAGSRPTSTADINGDGIADIMVGSNVDDALFLLFGRGDGTFAYGRSYAGLIGASRATPGDFNGDGIIDIIATAANGSFSNIFLGNSDATGRRNNLQTVLDLTSVQGARDALTKTSQLLSRIGREQGSLGAALSRLQTVTANLRITGENYETARSRIVDADIANESANLTRNTILQQAASAVLAQANLQPQLALKLLQP